MAFFAAACTHEMTPIRTFLKTVDMCPRKESGIVKSHLQTKKNIIGISVIETRMMHVAAKNRRRTKHTKNKTTKRDNKKRKTKTTQKITKKKQKKKTKNKNKNKKQKRYV